MKMVYGVISGIILITLYVAGVTATINVQAQQFPRANQDMEDLKLPVANQSSIGEFGPLGQMQQVIQQIEDYNETTAKEQAFTNLTELTGDMEVNNNTTELTPMAKIIQSVKNTDLLGQVLECQESVEEKEDLSDEEKLDQLQACGDM